MAKLLSEMFEEFSRSSLTNWYVSSNLCITTYFGSLSVHGPLEIRVHWQPELKRFCAFPGRSRTRKWIITRSTSATYSIKESRRAASVLVRRDRYLHLKRVYRYYAHKYFLCYKRTMLRIFCNKDFTMEIMVTRSARTERGFGSKSRHLRI